MRCLGGVCIVDKRESDQLSGSPQLPRDAGSVWCEAQVQPLKRMVSAAVLPRVVTRVGRCREATLAICPARHRIDLAMPTTFLRSGSIPLIILMRRFIFSMYSLEIFTPLLSEITVT